MSLYFHRNETQSGLIRNVATFSHSCHFTEINIVYPSVNQIKGAKLNWKQHKFHMLYTNVHAWE